MNPDFHTRIEEGIPAAICNDFMVFEDLEREGLDDSERVRTLRRKS